MKYPEHFDKLIRRLLASYGDKGTELFRMIDANKKLAQQVFGLDLPQSTLCFRLGKALRQVEKDGQYAGVSVRGKKGPAANRLIHFYFFVGPANDVFRFDGRCWMCNHRGTNWLDGTIECHADPPTHRGYPPVGGAGAPAGSPPFCSRFIKGNGVRFSQTDIDKATKIAKTEARIAAVIRESVNAEDEEENILQLGRTLVEEQKTEKENKS